VILNPIMEKEKVIYNLKNLVNVLLDPGTPPESGSRFRSPGSVYSSKQSEPDSTIATYESKSDYQDKLKGIQTPFC
jgi:hypothetical protein